MRGSRGFTITELVVGVAIMMLMAAITIPVAFKVKEKASITNSISNLQQIGMALNMYRASYDGDGKYGYWAQMGMPPHVSTLVPTGYIESGRLECTGLPIPTNPNRERYHPASWKAEDWKHLESEGFHLEYWGPYVERYQENAIAVYDIHHPRDGFSGIPYSPMDSWRSIGLYLAGSVKVRVRAGDPERRKWWHDDW